MMLSLKCPNCPRYADIVDIHADRLIYACACCGVQIHASRCPRCNGSGFLGNDPCSCSKGLGEIAIGEAARANIQRPVFK